MLKSKQVIVFAEKSIGIEEIRNVTTDEPTNLQHKRKTTETSSSTMPFQAEEETFATRGKRTNVPEQNNIDLSDDDDDITDKETNEFECF